MEVVFIEAKANTQSALRSFGKRSPGFQAMPHLISLPQQSFKRFLQTDLRQIFEQYFPVEDQRGRFILEFIDLEVGDPQISEEEARKKDATFGAPLRGEFRVIRPSTGEVKQQKVLMGNLPIMTSRGSFIINGAERVVVNQLIRSPGVYFSARKDDLGNTVAEAAVMPERGAWMRFEISADKTLTVRLDRSMRRIPATVLLKALGVGDSAHISDIFDRDPIIETTLLQDNTGSQDEALIAIYALMNPGQPSTLDGARTYLNNLLQDPARYSLAPVGRYKINHRLNALRRAHGLNAAEDIIDADGNIVFRRGQRIDSMVIPKDKSPLRIPVEIGGQKTVLLNYPKPPINQMTLLNEDILAIISFLLAMARGVGSSDDVDHLGNRRIRTVGELLANQCSIGLARVVRGVRTKLHSLPDDAELPSPRQLLASRGFISAIREFFNNSRLSQYMDHTNTLSELTHKRRLSALGPGGLRQETATLATRDVHHSHYGRICPIETPEGQNVGLLATLASYARINEYGFLETPYARVNKITGEVTNQIEYLTADEEEGFIIAPFDAVSTDGKLPNGDILARYRGQIQRVDAGLVDFVDIAANQPMGLSASLIPFLENTDAIRAGMGANMQRQAVPLINAQAPLVMTGVEERAARDSQAVVVAKNDGVVVDVRPDCIYIERKDGGVDNYPLRKFQRTNASTCLNQRPAVSKGQQVRAGDLLADNSDTDQGMLALGTNALVAFLSWEGYNYEDAIIISERLVKDDRLTSVHINSYEIDVRTTKLGDEIVTADIPNVPARHRQYLDENGIVVTGARVGPGDILVGKLTPRGSKALTHEERLLEAMLGRKAAMDVRNTSLTLPHGEHGYVIGHEILSKEKGDDLPPGVLRRIRVYVAQKLKIAVGDKLSGRHGNKGVIARILPEADMPFMADGRRIDVILSPLGVPSRMNLGQILEAHLGFAAQQMGVRAVTPVFSGATAEDVLAALEEAGLAPKMKLYDGRTGEPFEQEVTVGCLYILKLHHIVEEKMHARSVGPPYSLITQQPLGGKSQFGGQRFGEMEVWALEAHGAAHTLQEMLTIKSDDVGARTQAYEALLEGRPLPEPQRPESLLVLIRELNALGFKIRLLDKNGKEIDIINSMSPRYKE